VVARIDGTRGLAGSTLAFASVTDATLHLQLDYELPPELSVGAGTAVFVSGWCFSPAAPIRSLAFEVNHVAQPVAAARMPRLDLFRALHPSLDPYATEAVSDDPASESDPRLLGYRSGFWGTVEIRPPCPSKGWTLGLRAELADGSLAHGQLGTMRPAPAIESLNLPWQADASGPRVAIAMATFEPPRDLFARQVESIRAQTHGNWICVISDDGSSAAGQAAIAELTEGDPRFIVSRSPRRLGFYLNFERALSLLPSDVEFVALADQDDVWHADKLATLLAGLGNAQLVYSDARVVSRESEPISETWWSRRRNNHSDLLSLLSANAVTGAASLFRRELLDYVLPFPPAQFAHFHDHWIGLTALALGDIDFVARPLYDYVQHGGASLGHEAANRMTPLLDRLRGQRAIRERVRLWRLHYFADVCRLVQFATVLRLRCAGRMTASKRRALDRFLGLDRSWLALGALGARGARELVGTPETLGAEWMLFHALLWRRLLGASTRERPQRRLRLDALPPPTLVQTPGRSGSPTSVSSIAEKIAPLSWSVSDRAPERINLLIPTVDLAHFFGGYIAKFNLARRLAERGHRVRVVTVDPVGALPPGWREATAGYAGLDGLFERVEITFGREAPAVEISRRDRFIATTWWTAHIADDALRWVDAERFLYLIQEYEPFTFPMGTYAALADQSYTFPHFALFSSELLRGYFRARAIGVFAGAHGGGERESASFQNAITAVDPPTAVELAARTTRRLLFYARPESHAARNMFELGMLALERALREGLLGGWELNGIGTVERGRRLGLSGGHVNLLPRADQSTYARLLRDHDVGLALMYTPHPSLVPLEMASAGMVTVTNSFENKTVDVLSTISENLIAAPPSIDGVLEGLRKALASVSDAQRRVRGSAVAWSRDWNRSFSDELLDHAVGGLGPPRGERERDGLVTPRIEAGDPLRR
jgi:glycosyltransferase involved in cell wall biosynthesis